MADTMRRTPSAERAAVLYDAAYARRYREHDEELPASVPSQQLAAWLHEICERFDRPIDALDLGCGTGRYFWALSGVRSLVGIDASAAMIAEARQPYRRDEITVPTITLLVGDLLAQCFAAASFDLVYSIGVIAEHAPLSQALVNRVATWLRPDGRFAFTTVHPDSPSIRQTMPRRVATAIVRAAPRGISRRLQERLLAGGMYADEAMIERLGAPQFTIESMDRFTSEAHLHVRAVLRKR